MGRKEDKIWSFFKKIESDGRTRAQCQMFLGNCPTCWSYANTWKMRGLPVSTRRFRAFWSWKSGVRLGFDRDFAEFAGGLVESISSSAELERQFSSVGMSYGKLRSNLGVRKAGKMAFLYTQLNSVWLTFVQFDTDYFVCIIWNKK